MQFTIEDLSPPNTDLGLPKWGFRADLRNHFDMERNYHVAALLRERGVLVKSNDEDSETSCMYVDFKNEAAARAFLKRLNKQPEVVNYEEAKPVRYVAITETEWDILIKFLNANMSEKKLKAMVALPIQKRFVTIEE
jgi:hypothetical protein